MSYKGWRKRKSKSGKETPAWLTRSGCWETRYITPSNIHERIMCESVDYQFLQKRERKQPHKRYWSFLWNRDLGETRISSPQSSNISKGSHAISDRPVREPTRDTLSSNTWRREDRLLAMWVSLPAAESLCETLDNKVF